LKVALGPKSFGTTSVEVETYAEDIAAVPPLQDLMAEGHSAGQIVLQLHDVIVPSRDLSDAQKSAICERLAVVDKRLMDGADEYLQVLDLCTVIMQQVCYAT